MKVLVLSTNGIKQDGITAWTLLHYSMIREAGVEVHSVAYPGTPDALLTKFNDAGIFVEMIPNRKNSPIAYFRALRTLVRRERYDIVHVNGNSGTVALDLASAGFLRRAPLRIVHSRNTKGNHPVADRLLRPLMNALASARFACGEAAGKWLFRDAPFEIVRNGKNFDDYSFDLSTRMATRQQLGVPADAIVVGHVGNFTAQKNHLFLLRVFAKAHAARPELRLVLTGDGSLRGEAESLASKLQIAPHVLFLGSRTDVRELLCAFDVAVLPSLHEGFPNVVLEWQLNGLPSLISSSVSDECALTDLVRVVPAEVEEAWAEALVRQHPVDRESVSATARRRLADEGYEAAAVARHLLSRYKSMAAQRVDQRLATTNEVDR